MDVVATKDQNIAEFIEHVNSYEIHKNKLESIRKEIEDKLNNKYKVVDQQAELLKLRILNNRLKSHEFEANERINEIKRNNQLLLDKLLDISKGKWAAPGMKAKQTKKRIGPKSLNYVTKKREMERIDHENLKLMNRIVNQNPMLNTKKFEKEYRDRRRLQKSLQRNRLLPIKQLMSKKKKQHERSTSKLPALQNPATPSLNGNDNHPKMPQSVSNSKKRGTGFTEKKENMAKDESNIEQDVEKTPQPNTNSNTTRKTTKGSPVKKQAYKPVLNKETPKPKPKAVVKPAPAKEKDDPYVQKKSSISNASKKDAASTKSVQSKKSSSKEVAKSPITSSKPKIGSKPQLDSAPNIENESKKAAESKPASAAIQDKPAQKSEKSLGNSEKDIKAAPEKQDKVKEQKTSAKPEVIMSKEKLDESIDSAYDSFDDDLKDEVKEEPTQPQKSTENKSVSIVNKTEEPKVVEKAKEKLIEEKAKEAEKPIELEKSKVTEQPKEIVKPKEVDKPKEIQKPKEVEKPKADPPKIIEKPKEKADAFDFSDNESPRSIKAPSGRNDPKGEAGDDKIEEDYIVDDFEFE